MMLELLLLAYLVYQLVKEYGLRKRLPTAGAALRGQRVVVTGASSGIGRSLALEYAQHGADVVLAARRADRLAAVAGECRRLEAGGSVHVVLADLTRLEDCERLVGEGSRLLGGGLDLLVLNAGRGTGFDQLVEQDAGLTEYRAVFEINYFACVALTRLALPLLAASKGQVVAVSSVAGLFHPPGRTGYAPSKAALNAFFNSLRYDSAVAGTVALTVACPGYVVTEIHDRLLAGGQERNMAEFMSAETCAQLVVEAGLNRDRVRLLNPFHRLSTYLLPFLPDRLRDRLLLKKAIGAFTAKAKAD